MSKIIYFKSGFRFLCLVVLKARLGSTAALALASENNAKVTECVPLHHVYLYNLGRSKRQVLFTNA